MTNLMMKRVLAARTLALAVAIVGVALGSDGVATATPVRTRTAAGMVASGDGGAVDCRSSGGDARVTACDDDPDSGNGDDGGDDGDDAAS